MIMMFLLPMLESSGNNIQRNETPKYFNFYKTNADLNHFVGDGDRLMCLMKENNFNTLIEVDYKFYKTRIVSANLNIVPDIVDISNQELYSVQSGKIICYGFNGQKKRDYDITIPEHFYKLYLFNKKLFVVEARFENGSDGELLRYEFTELLSGKTKFVKRYKLPSKEGQVPKWFITNIGNQYACCSADSLCITIFNKTTNSKEISNPFFKNTQYSSEEISTFSPVRQSMIQMTRYYYPMVVGNLFAFNKRLFAVRVMRPKESMLYIDIFNLDRFLATKSFNIPNDKKFVDVIALSTKVLMIVKDTKNYYCADISSFCK
jgi:hypothetical protein